MARASIVLLLVLAVGCGRDEAREAPADAAPTGAVAGAVSRLLASAAGSDDDAEAVVGALAALGEPAVPRLAQALEEEPKPSVRLIAAEALAKIGPASTEALIGGLDDGSDEVRLAVVEKLGALRDRKAVQPLLTRYARDDDGQVRYECLTSLGRIGDPAAAELLVAETKSEDQYVRMWAMDALCQMRDARAPALARSLLRDPSPYVRRQVADSCDRALDSSEGRRALVDLVLSDPDFQPTIVARRDLVGYVDAKTPGAADEIRALALAALPGPQSLRAALLLGDLRDPAAIDRLIEALKDPDHWIRHHAAFLLARIGDPRAVPALVAALGDPVELVAVTAYTSLQPFADRGDERAKEALAGYKGRRPTERVQH